MRVCFILFYFILFLSACRDNDIAEYSNYRSQTIELNDVANFESQESLLLALEEYETSGITPRELKSISKNLSLKSTLESDTLEEDVDTLICSDAFRDFLNDRYELIVGDIFLRITEQGTFITSRENQKWLDSLTITDNTIKNHTIVNAAFGYSYENGLYKLNSFDNLYMYDTFGKIDSTNCNMSGYNISYTSLNSTTSLKATYLDDPVESDFNIISRKGTFFGKAIDSALGFSYSSRNNFDGNKYRIDVKVYSQNFIAYWETGVKSKTQKKGWTSIWRKCSADEIRSGYRFLGVNENFGGSILKKTLTYDDNLKYLDFYDYYKNRISRNFWYIGYGLTTLDAGSFLTFNFVYSDLNSIEIDYNLIRKMLEWSYRNGHITTDDIDYSNCAIRFIENNGSNKNAKLYFIDLCKKTTNRKCTFKLASGFGKEVKVELEWTPETGFNISNFKAKESKNLTYLSGTEMYGVARRGRQWQGVLYKFK